MESGIYMAVALVGIGHREQDRYQSDTAGTGHARETVGSLPGHWPKRGQECCLGRRPTPRYGAQRDKGNLS